MQSRHIHTLGRAEATLTVLLGLISGGVRKIQAEPFGVLSQICQIILDLIIQMEMSMFCRNKSLLFSRITI